MTRNHYILWLCLTFAPIVCGQGGMLPVGSNADALAQRIRERDSSKIGTRLPFFTASESDDSVFYSGATKRVALYYFWYDCGDPCLGAFDLLNELQQRYSGKADFFAVTYLGKAQLADVLTERPLHFRHCRITQDELNSIGLSNGYPFTLITVDGVIMYCKSGGPIVPAALEKRREEYEGVLRMYCE